MLPSTLECNFKLNFMTRHSNSVNKDYELKTQYFMSQIITITCSGVVLKVHGKVTRVIKFESI